MAFTRNFTELNRHNADLAGGKGASLGEMTQAGIPVPPGFVVLSESFERFIKETDLVQEIDAILDKVDHKVIHTVEAASESIRALILSREMPQDIADEIVHSFNELDTKYVAVRSSATAEDGTDHAWAGQLESYLNTAEEDVLIKVKLCWSSLFTPRAIFYRFEKGLHTTKISVAVVVQKMVESEVSGIAFSVHPVTEDRNQLIIEAGFGLGEAIVSGSITPDSYVVEKEPRNILDINISTQSKGLYRSENASVEHGNNEWKDIPEPKASSQVLTKEQILELSEIILKIENHYGFPCDIEWAYEAGKFYIVQSRPITTLSAGSENNVAPLKSGFSKFSAIASSRTWRKDWEGTFSILLSNMSTIPYFENFKEEFGVNIENTITTHKNGLASCFISIEDEKRFGDEMSGRVLDNPSLLNEWSDRTKREYDNVFSLINLETAEILTKESLGKLIRHVQRFTAYLGAIKYVSNFLEKSVIDEHGRSIFEARAYTEKIFPALEALANNISEYIGKKEGYAPELIPAMTTKELVRYVDMQGLPERSILEERKKSSAYLYQNTISEIVGDEVLQVEKIIYGENTDILYGTGVYPGKVTGKVKVILEFGKQYTKFEEGDILVSGMTDPNFVPLMKKAKAIITDGGGVLCHAAIVSRELGVPCVIGTGKATQVLKDGDEVEVDADAGIVRIIK